MVDMGVRARSRAAAGRSRRVLQHAQHVLQRLRRAAPARRPVSDRRRGPYFRLLTSPGERSRAHMIYDVGSTITLEAWDNRFKPNQDRDHPWGAEPADLIPRRRCRPANRNDAHPANPGDSSAVCGLSPARTPSRPDRFRRSKLLLISAPPQIHLSASSRSHGMSRVADRSRDLVGRRQEAKPCRSQRTGSTTRAATPTSALHNGSRRRGGAPWPTTRPGGSA